MSDDDMSDDDAADDDAADDDATGDDDAASDFTPPGGSYVVVGDEDGPSTHLSGGADISAVLWAGHLDDVKTMGIRITWDPAVLSLTSHQRDDATLADDEWVFLDDEGATAGQLDIRGSAMGSTRLSSDAAVSLWNFEFEVLSDESTVVHVVLSDPEAEEGDVSLGLLDGDAEVITATALATDVN
jgi:hypothetical protein